MTTSALLGVGTHAGTTSSRGGVRRKGKRFSLRAEQPRDFQPGAACQGAGALRGAGHEHPTGGSSTPACRPLPGRGGAARLRQSPRNNSATSVCINALYAHRTGTERVCFP